MLPRRRWRRWWWRQRRWRQCEVPVAVPVVIVTVPARRRRMREPTASNLYRPISPAAGGTGNTQPPATTTSGSREASATTPAATVAARQPAKVNPPVWEPLPVQLFRIWNNGTTTSWPITANATTDGAEGTMVKVMARRLAPAAMAWRCSPRSWHARRRPRPGTHAPEQFCTMWDKVQEAPPTQDRAVWSGTLSWRYGHRHHRHRHRLHPLPTPGRPRRRHPGRGEGVLEAGSEQGRPRSPPRSPAGRSPPASRCSTTLTVSALSAEIRNVGHPAAEATSTSPCRASRRPSVSSAPSATLNNWSIPALLQQLHHPRHHGQPCHLHRHAVREATA